MTTIHSSGSRAVDEYSVMVATQSSGAGDFNRKIEFTGMLRFDGRGESMRIVSVVALLYGALGTRSCQWLGEDERTRANWGFRMRGKCSTSVTMKQWVPCCCFCMQRVCHSLRQLTNCKSWSWKQPQRWRPLRADFQLDLFVLHMHACTQSIAHDHLESGESSRSFGLTERIVLWRFSRWLYCIYSEFLFIWPNFINLFNLVSSRTIAKL